MVLRKRRSDPALPTIKSLNVYTQTRDLQLILMLHRYETFWWILVVLGLQERVQWFSLKFELNHQYHADTSVPLYMGVSMKSASIVNNYPPIHRATVFSWNIDNQWPLVVKMMYDVKQHFFGRLLSFTEQTQKWMTSLYLVSRTMSGFYHTKNLLKTT